MKKELNTPQNLARLLTNNQITFEEFLFRSKAFELDINTWNCWSCEAENTHNVDDFGFCRECLESQ
tara:strand:- start:980 stop:1177 length:198 start_codon:yes stop_codon:yes gene_type:complete